jgi:hypothetical protein
VCVHSEHVGGDGRGNEADDAAMARPDTRKRRGIRRDRHDPRLQRPDLQGQWPRRLRHEPPGSRGGHRTNAGDAEARHCGNAGCSNTLVWYAVIISIVQCICQLGASGGVIFLFFCFVCLGICQLGVTCTSGV